MTKPEKMQGLFKTAKGPGNMALMDAPIPSPKVDEVLIEVKAAGICGTDIHIRHDSFPYWPPVIMGHEFSGVVVEAGSTVSNFAVGDRVVAEPHTKACGKCELCRTGHIQLCSEKRSPGWGIDGAFARFIAMPEHLLHRLPDSVSFQEAALVEPTANVVQDVLERGIVEPNDFVVVLGPGPIGLLSVMVARAAGARTVALIGTAADESMRLPLGREIGADEIIVSGQQDIVRAVQDLTDGRGADLVVEASGAAPAIAATPHLVRRLGRITVIGMTGQDAVAFPWDAAIWKVCTIVFNLSTGFTSWEKTIGLIASKQIDVARLITHSAPLTEWESVFDAVEEMQAVKALLIP
ncbi:MAG: zinc-binding dehydrogenase [Anaerolineae bacterium]|nr:MAG: zinc-binding dehydrogenase [Anaerolineae bacterium]